MNKKCNNYRCGRRDFHNFNTYYRDNDNYNVVAFTAAQIPDIDDRMYPGELAASVSGYTYIFPGQVA